MSKPTNKAKCSIFRFCQNRRSILSVLLFAAHPVPALATVLHWLAMWGNVATTAGHLPAMARTDCCLPGLPADHTDPISVSSFFVIASLTSGHCSECLQWPVAAYCSTGLHIVGGDTPHPANTGLMVTSGHRPDCSASLPITPLLPRPEKLTRIIDQGDNSHSHPTFIHFIQGFLINLKK